MPVWNSEQYLRFARERTQPSRDLAARLSVADGAEVLDLGCGPGNSTAVLAERLPGAHVTGGDISAEMLARARADHPELDFIEFDAAGDLSAHEGHYAVVFSNACLQWVPDHRTLLPRLVRLLAPGGTLAVQVPLTDKQLMYQQVIWPVTESERWAAKLNQPRTFHTLTTEEYLDVLDACAESYELWETTYYHLLPDAQAILEWYRGSGLRPYLQALAAEDRAAFEADILAAIREAYPPRAAGGVTLPFPRLFFTARRAGCTCAAGAVA